MNDVSNSVSVDTRVRDVKRRIVRAALGQTFAFFTVAALLLIVAPRFTKIFADFGAELPAMTILAIQIHIWFGKYWFLVLPVWIGYVVACGVLYSSGEEDFARILHWTFIAWAVATIAFFTVAMTVPLVVLVEKLS